MAFETNYVENEILSLNKDELISFIYRGLLDYLDKIKKSIEQNNPLEKVNMINKSIDVISYLRSILDYEKGGIIAKNLNNLYLFAIKELTDSNFSNNTDKIISVENIFKELLTTWNEMIKKNKEEQKGNNHNELNLNDNPQEKRVEIYG
jgi:flagellar protein FliS